MEEENMISMTSWKKAVSIFWSDVVKLDLKQSFTCSKCGPLPSTLVFDGVTFGLQWRKVMKFHKKMKLLLGR